MTRNLPTVISNQNNEDFWLSSFRSVLLLGKIKRGSISNYLSDIKGFLIWFNNYLKENKITLPTQTFGEKMNLIDEKVIDLFVESLKKENSIKSINRRLSSLRKFGTYCRTQLLTRKNSFENYSNLTTINSSQKISNDISLLILFRQYLDKGGIKNGSALNYLSDMRSFFIWVDLYFKKQGQILNLNDSSSLISKVNRELISEYLNELKRGQIPTLSLNRRISTLKKFGLFLLSQNLISENIFDIYQKEVPATPQPSPVIEKSNLPHENLFATPLMTEKFEYPQPKIEPMVLPYPSPQETVYSEKKNNGRLFAIILILFLLLGPISFFGSKYLIDSSKSLLSKASLPPEIKEVIKEQLPAEPAKEFDKNEIQKMIKENIEGLIAQNAQSNKFSSIDVGITSLFSVNEEGVVTDGTWHGDKIAIAYGGTGITQIPQNGQLLIGNGSNYTLANLSPGTDITISNSPGQITIAHADPGSQGSSDNSNGTVIQDITLDTLNHVTGIGTIDFDGRYLGIGVTIGVSKGGTGLATLPTSGQILIGNASGGYTLSSLTAGTGVSITNGSGTITISSSSSSGSGTTYSANNGITLASGFFQLGGQLSQLTKIDQNSNDFALWNTGNIGIGNTNPGYKLDVTGDGRFTTDLNVGASLSVTDNVKFSGLAVGAGTTAVFVDANGNLSKAGLGTNAFSSATYDNYQFWNLEINGAGTTAINSTNTVNFSAGSGISLSQNGSAITISSTGTGTGTTYSANNGITLNGSNFFQLGGQLIQPTYIDQNSKDIGFWNAGNFGIGLSSPTNKFVVYSARTDSITNMAIFTGTLNIAGTAAPITARGNDIHIYNDSTAGNISDLQGQYVEINVRNAGTVSRVKNFSTWGTLSGAGNISEWMHFDVGNISDSGAGTLANQYGLKIADLTSATNNWSIYTGSAKSHFGGNVNVGGSFTVNTNSFIIDNAGNITAGAWKGTAVGVSYGGTGANIGMNTGAVIYASSNTAMAATAVGTSNQLLVSSGDGSPVWVNQSVLTGTTYSANNGITLSSGFFQLGGTLNQLTKIDLNNNNFGFYGTGNVGIGTTNPAAAFQVGQGIGGTAGFVVTSDGKVGIGTTSPANRGLNIRLVDDGAVAYAIYNTLNTNNNNIYGMYNDETVDTSSEVGYGVYNAINATVGATGIGYGTYNNMDAGGTLAGTYNDISSTAAGNSLYGAYNDLTVAGTSSKGYGSYTIITTTAANGQIGYGDYVELKTGAGDSGYGGYVVDSLGTSSGGTQYGLYVNLDDADVTNYSIFIPSTSGMSYFGSNVGIGTSSQGAQLDVTGTIRASIGVTSPLITLSTGAGAGKILQSDASGNASWVTATGVGGTYTASNGLTMVGSDVRLGGTLSALTTINQNGNDFGFYGTGNVGIGTTSPAFKLDITDSQNNFFYALNLKNTNTGASAAVFANFQSGTGSLAIGTLGSSNTVFTGYGGPDDSFIYNSTNQNNLNFINKSTSAIRFFTNSDASSAPKVVINSTGNLGIGISSPLRLLDVNSAIVRFRTTAPAAPTLVNDGDFAIGSMSRGPGITTGRIWIMVGASTYTFKSDWNSISDYSEFFYQGDESAESGDLVAVDSLNSSPIADTGKVKKSSLPYESTLTGVVTVNSRGTSYNNPNDDRWADPNFANVGMLGHVYTKVNTENGPIQKGDFITSSSTAGVGMKAKMAGQTVGKALEDYNGTGTGKIWVLINPGWYDPTVFVTNGNDFNLSNIGDSFNLSLKSTGETIQKLVYGSEAIFAKIQAGIINATRLNVQESIVSPLIETAELKSQKISSDIISPLSSGDITFDLSSLNNLGNLRQGVSAPKSGFGKLLVKGNAEFTGNVGIGTTNPVYRLQLPNIADASGQGLANAWTTYSSMRWNENVRTINNALEKIGQLNPIYFDWKPENGGTHDIGFIAEEVGKVVPEVVTWENNGVDAKAVDYSKLTSLAIRGIQEQQQQIASLSARLQSLEAASLQSPSDTLTASQSALLTNVGLGTNNGPDATVSGNLVVSGKTTLSDLSVTGKVTSGLLIIEGLDEQDGSSLSTLSGPLRLQANALGNLEIMAGKVLIDTKGNLSVNGTFTAKKINIDESDTPSKSTGEATILAGELETLIETSAASESSRIFVTPKDKPVPFAITNQQSGSFKIIIDTLSENDLKFSYWVIN